MILSIVDLRAWNRAWAALLASCRCRSGVMNPKGHHSGAWGLREPSPLVPAQGGGSIRSSGLRFNAGSLSELMLEHLRALHDFQEILPLRLFLFGRFTFIPHLEVFMLQKLDVQALR